MIVVDTNVVSELMRDDPATPVSAWIANAARADLAPAATVFAELSFGAETAPDGRRRNTSQTNWNALSTLAPWHGSEVRRRCRVSLCHASGEAASRGPPHLDRGAQIEAVCAARGATLATRNARDFEGLGIQLVNP